MNGKKLLKPVGIYINVLADSDGEDKLECDEFQAMLSKMTARMPVDRRFAQVYLHDPLTVATVFTQDFVTVEAFHLAPAKRFGVFRTLPQNRLPPNALVVTDLDGSAFKRLFAERVFGVILR